MTNFLRDPGLFTQLISCQKSLILKITNKVEANIFHLVPAAVRLQREKHRQMKIKQHQLLGFKPDQEGEGNRIPRIHLAFPNVPPESLSFSLRQSS